VPVGASAVDAAKDLALFFHPMSNDPASTMRTVRSECLNRAFETVENVPFVPDDYFEGLIVVISADFAGRHFFSFRFISGSSAGAPLDARPNCPKETGAAADSRAWFPLDLAGSPLMLQKWSHFG
jgi:hypothetical protein